MSFFEESYDKIRKDRDERIKRVISSNKGFKLPKIRPTKQYDKIDNDLKYISSKVTYETLFKKVIQEIKESKIISSNQFYSSAEHNILRVLIKRGILNKDSKKKPFDCSLTEYGRRFMSVYLALHPKAIKSNGKWYYSMCNHIKIY